MYDPEIAKNKIKVDPDPVSIGLAVLGALGSVASIVSYLESRTQQRGEIYKFVDPISGFWGNKSASTKTKFKDRITKLDASLEDLKGRLQTLESLLSDVDYLNGENLSRLRFEFGAVQPLLEKQDLLLFFRIQNEVNILCTKITKECQALIRLLDDTGYNPTPEIHAKLHQLRHMLNKALRSELRFTQVIDLNIKSIETALIICEHLNFELESFYE